MKKEANRIIFIITGSDCSGKSKLGHLLGFHKDALFSYATIPYHKYFNQNNFVIYENKVEELKKVVERIFNFQNGGYTKYGSSSLRSDKLFFYDFKKIIKYLKLKIKKKITISNFYYYWNEALILGRKKGSETLFTVLEIENLFNNKVINHLTKSNKNIKIINIYRNPLDQIKSQKINTLLRGGLSKNGFNGALSGKINHYNYQITSIIEQYNFIKKKNQVMHIKLNDLKPIKLKDAIILSNYLGNRVDKNFLMRGSMLTNYKNQYIDLKRENQSFRSKTIQKHFSLKYLLDKKNIENHMYSYERLFYLTITKSITVKKFKQNRFVFLYLQLMSLFFGFSDIRKGLPFRNFVRKRINSFKIVNNVKKLLTDYKFLNN